MRLSELAGALGAALQGGEAGGTAARELELNAVSSAEAAGPQTLIFVEDEKGLGGALRSAAGAVLAPPRLGGAFAAASAAVLVHPEPRLAFARAARLLDPPRSSDVGVHATAVVAASAVLGDKVTVGACAVLEARVRVGARSMVHAGAVLREGVVVGADCVIHPRVVLYPGVRLGDRVILHAGAVLGGDGFGYVRDPATGAYSKFPQQGTLVVEDDVEVGANTTIDRGALGETRIGWGTKLDNLVHVGHNVRVGADVVIAAQTGISGSSTVGDGAVIAGQVGIGDHAGVGPGVILGGQAGILPHKQLEGPGQLFWGTPAKPVKQYLRELARLARLGRGRDA